MFSHAPEANVNTNPSFYTHQKALQKVTSYIKQNLSEKLTLHSLARVAELSPSYFHKLFCEMFNQTPNEYILDCRISQAKLLLTSTDKSILEISEDFRANHILTTPLKKLLNSLPFNIKERC